MTMMMLVMMMDMVPGILEYLRRQPTESES
jgi:hypothetical protein